MSARELTTQELLEMASLDALGLLEPEERKAFERAFRDAAPEVRAEIRREQSRLTSQHELLPDVEPPAGLRGRVLAAVSEAIGVVRGREVVGSIAPGAWALRRNVSPLWRAAAIGFATATIVLLGVGFDLHRSYRDTLVQFQSGTLIEEVRKLDVGAKFISLALDEDAHHVRFAPVSNDTGAEAILVMDADLREAILVCRGLDALPSGQYHLTLVDPATERAASHHRFETNGELMGQRVDAFSMKPGMRIEIVAVSADGSRSTPVLTSAI